MQQEKKAERVKEDKKINREYKYNVNIKGDKIIIDPVNFDSVLMQRALNYYEQAIKNYIAKSDK